MRFLLSILFCWSCVAATITTKTVKESGGDYTTLSAWEAGRQADIVAGDRIELASIEGSWTSADTSAFTISGWTTDATRYICITNSTSKHDGKRFDSASTAYRLVVSSASSAIIVEEEYVRIYGLQIKVGNSGGTYYGIMTDPAATSDIRIGYCIITANASTSIWAVRSAAANATVKLFNSIIYSTGSSGYCVVCQNSTSFNVYNVTGFGGSRTYYRGGGTLNCYNCVAQGASSGGYVGTIGGDYNIGDASDDPPGTNPADQTLDVAFVGESAGSEDFHLGSTQPSGVLDSTSDQSSGLFADDIDYVARSGSWDIGADEYVAAATSAGQIIIIRQQ